MTDFETERPLRGAGGGLSTLRRLRLRRVVILDEPFVGLDPPVAGEITALLKRVAAEHGIALSRSASSRSARCLSLRMPP